MDDLDYELLTWLESGHPVLEPAEPTEAARQAFQHTAARVLALQERGLIHVAAAQISRSGSGRYLRIGPCALSAKGSAVLVNAGGLVPRPPREVWLKPEFACLYDSMPAGTWLSASVWAEVLVTRAQRGWQLDFRQRTFSPRHFEFRGGPEPRKPRERHGRTRREDWL